MSHSEYGERLDAQQTEKVFAALRDRLSGLSRPAFGNEILAGLSVKSLALYNVEVDASGIKRKQNAKAVLTHEIVATEKMLNAKGSVHGACWALLLDVCSSWAIGALGNEESFRRAGISADMSERYLAPAFPGDRLTIVSTTISQTFNTAIAETKVYNDKGRLLFVGQHRKANVDKPRPSKL